MLVPTVGLANSQGETNTWEHRQLTAPDGRTPSFRSSSYAGEKWFAASIESPAWILQTSSNGWAPNWVHHDTNAAVFLDAMAWWDDKEGMVFGDPIDGCIHLLMTQDAGETWSAVSCDHLPPSMEGEAGFAASNGNVCIRRHGMGLYRRPFLRVFEPWTAG